VSYVEGLKVGAAIEELDMVDINTAMLQVDNQDIRLVYDNLLKGSRNHLRSYVKTLANQGVTYVPQYMAVADYTAIVTTAIER
jgi:ERCC4-type nuclease